MPLLQRIRFPESSSLQPLYYRIEGAWEFFHDSYVLGKGAVCVLDSFYNACFIGRGGWPESVGTLTCRLCLTGDFDVSIVFRALDGRETVLETRQCLGCTTGNYQEFSISRLPERDGRVFLVLRSLVSESSIRGGEYTCEKNPENPVRLGVVICTHHREDEVLENLRKIAGDPILNDIRILVVDNGRSLSADLIPGNCRLIPNENDGGAGGFSRGILTLLEQGNCTHAVLMDDDVQLDTEGLHRSRRHFEYAPESALAGALLSVENPCTSHEVGADLDPAHPLRVLPKLVGINLGDAGGLSAWQQWEGAQYGGFWFFGFPLESVRDAGMLLPVFVKADDIEFGLRLTKQGIPIDIQAGVGVHHSGFSDFDLSKRYYWVRNMLIVRMLHDFPLSLTVKGLLSDAMKELRSGRSGFLLALALGTEDFLKGPSWLEAVDDQLLMASIKTARTKNLPGFLWWIRAMTAAVRCALLCRGLRRRWRLAAAEYASAEYWKRRCHHI